MYGYIMDLEKSISLNERYMKLIGNQNAFFLTLPDNG